MSSADVERLLAVLTRLGDLQDDVKRESTIYQASLKRKIAAAGGPSFEELCRMPYPEWAAVRLAYQGRQPNQG